MNIALLQKKNLTDQRKGHDEKKFQRVFYNFFFHLVLNISHL